MKANHKNRRLTPLTQKFNLYQETWDEVFDLISKHFPAALWTVGVIIHAAVIYDIVVNPVYTLEDKILAATFPIVVLVVVLIVGLAMTAPKRPTDRS